MIKRIANLRAALAAAQAAGAQSLPDWSLAALARTRHEQGFAAGIEVAHRPFTEVPPYKTYTAQEVVAIIRALRPVASERSEDGATAAPAEGEE